MSARPCRRSPLTRSPDAGSRQAAEKVLLVHVTFGFHKDPEEAQEFLRLAESAGAEIAGEVEVRRERPDPAFFIGKGKVAAIAAQAEGVDLILFDRALTPVQERNLERALGRPVLDRVGLILDIFARRAHTHEGKLQVELAQLRHLRTRLVRGWTHLERQRGGIGLRGPGETQLEMDRRQIANRIRTLEGRLAKVRADRAVRRRARSRAPTPTVALVGYTNAGKSSLFNALTAKGVYAADQLFATLDPSMARLPLPGGGSVVLADTVGFLRELPHDLIAAFRATLEEVSQADLLLHVVDASHPGRGEQIAAVDAVLDEIGAAALPRLLVLNKIDRTGEGPGLDRDRDGRPLRLRISVAEGRGLDLLPQAVEMLLRPNPQRFTLCLGPEEGALRAALRREGRILEEHYAENGECHLLVEIDEGSWRRLRTRYVGSREGWKCHHPVHQGCGGGPACQG